jgi:hypothetical protein
VLEPFLHGSEIILDPSVDPVPENCRIAVEFKTMTERSVQELAYVCPSNAQEEGARTTRAKSTGVARTWFAGVRGIRGDEIRLQDIQIQQRVVSSSRSAAPA